jgi:N-acyl-phosphatidylethanolamine-hydrolysing phospholipase D
VAARVLQRDGWNPGEAAPNPKALLPYWKEMLFPATPSQKELDAVFPVHDIQWEKLLSPPIDKIQCTWIGHSTMLVQMNGTNILTDPVFSKRCSPSQWFGPKRFRPPACSIRDLQANGIDVDVVLLSHNHYDHLDYKSVTDLANSSKTPLFVVPLGLKTWLEQYVSKSLEIVEMDWHEGFALEHVHISAVPMRHWTSRMGNDRDTTLWCGYVVSTNTQTFLFPGDTAWFDGLHDIGRDYGPFDLAGIPIGAYVPWDFMKAYHVDPPHAVAMVKAVRAKRAVPIHFGTFVLTFEPVMEPVEWLENINKGMDFAPWNIGDTVTSA